MSVFSDRLSEARKKCEMTQKEVADAIPMTQPSYSRIENGFHEPSLKQLKRIAEVLNVSIDYLLDVDTKFYNNQSEFELHEQLKFLYEKYISGVKGTEK